MEVDEDVETQEQQEQSRKLQRFTEDDDNTGIMRNWNNPSSRIIRVSRASGGKDRHSKVLTSKGLRDRRIRLSVATAIQFYDLQDRLGFDQPSKAVEWLINAASDSITELPPINTNFDQNHQTKSACSSGTSESSLLSLSRTEIRGKARERARERTAKERDKDLQNAQSSFTQLLTGGFDQQQPNNNRNWTGGSDFINPVQLIPNSSSSSLPQEPMNHPFSCVPDYNFGISSSSAAINGGYSSRGTLQSNSQSLFLNNNNNMTQRSSISSSSSSSSPMDSQTTSFRLLLMAGYIFITAKVTGALIMTRPRIGDSKQNASFPSISPQILERKFILKEDDVCAAVSIYMDPPLQAEAWLVLCSVRKEQLLFDEKLCYVMNHIYVSMCVHVHCHKLCSKL